MARGSPGGRGVSRGVQEVITILNEYDTFHWSRKTLAGLADLMILVSAITLAVVLWNRGNIPVKTITDAEVVTLSLILFGLSGCIFAIFRSVLFMIEAFMERAVTDVKGIRSTGFRSGGRNLKKALDTVSERLEDSIALWWTARLIVIRAVFVIIPGILFYLLGIANLVMYLVRTGLISGL